MLNPSSFPMWAMLLAVLGAHTGSGSREFAPSFTRQCRRKQGASLHKSRVGFLGLADGTETVLFFFWRVPQRCRESGRRGELQHDASRAEGCRESRACSSWGQQRSSPPLLLMSEPRLSSALHQPPAAVSRSQASSEIRKKKKKEMISLKISSLDVWILV